MSSHHLRAYYLFFTDEAVNIADEEQNEFICKYLIRANIITAANSISVVHSLKGPDRKHWIKVMNEEMRALAQNQTWDIEPRPQNK